MDSVERFLGWWITSDFAPTTSLIWFGLNKKWKLLFPAEYLPTPPHPHCNPHDNRWSFDNGQLTQADPTESFVSFSQLALRKSSCCSSPMRVQKCEICKPQLPYFPKQRDKAAESWREMDKRYGLRERHLMSSNPWFQFSLEPTCIPAIPSLSLRKRKIAPDPQQVAWHPWPNFPIRSSTEHKQSTRASTSEIPLRNSDGSGQT